MNINTDIMRGERKKGGGFFKIPQFSHPTPDSLQNTIAHFYAEVSLVVITWNVTHDWYVFYLYIFSFIESFIINIMLEITLKS